MDYSQLPTYVPSQLILHHLNIQIPSDVSEEDKPQHVLKTVFGYETFRAGQLEAIQTILNGDDCVVLMPTGGGKSMLYVISTIIKQGLTIVIQPLKFLMEEQVSTLRDKGIHALYFNSSLKKEADSVIHYLTRCDSQYVILFTSPECIFNAKLQSVVKTWQSNGKLSFVTIDELLRV
jgi:ATP-dependent DNA helicase RecQ